MGSEDTTKCFELRRCKEKKGVKLVNVSPKKFFLSIY